MKIKLRGFGVTSKLDHEVKGAALNRIRNRETCALDNYSRRTSGR